MKQRPKRFLALLLCAAMLFSLMPMMAFAEGETVAKIGDAEYESLDAALQEAGKTASDSNQVRIEIVKEGTYDIPVKMANISIVGKDGVNATFNSNKTYGQSVGNAVNVTFENLTFIFSGAKYSGFQHSENITFKNCTIKGMFYGYGAMIFDSCTFYAPGTEQAGGSKEYSMYTYGGSITYDNCHFYGEGKFINVYSEAGYTFTPKIVVTNCDFHNVGSSAGKSALNVKECDSSLSTAKMLKFDVEVSNCTTEGPFPANGKFDSNEQLYVVSPVVQIDDRKIGASSTDVVVKLDGKQVYPAPPNITTEVEVNEEKGITADIVDEIKANTAANKFNADVEDNVGNVAAAQSDFPVSKIDPTTGALEEVKIDVAADDTLEDVAGKFVAVAVSKDATITDTTDGMKVKLKEVTPDGMVFDVKPVMTITTKTGDAAPVSTEMVIPNELIKNEITFRLLLPSAFNHVTKVDVKHEGEAFKTDIDVLGDNGSRYVELKSNSFSEYNVAIKAVQSLQQDKYDAYLIKNQTDLEFFRDMVNEGNAAYVGATVKLANDITMTGEWNIGIGIDSEGKRFAGTFDGNGKSITNFAIDTTANYVGLFGSLYGTVKNLTLVEPSVKGVERVGAIAGYVNAASITNCAVIGGSVEGEEQVGGLLGQINSTHIIGCVVDGVTITATKNRAAAIVGRTIAGDTFSIVGNTVNNCTIYAADTYCGGTAAVLTANINSEGTETGKAYGNYQISDNIITGTTTTTGANTDFNPIGSFRDDTGVPAWMDSKEHAEACIVRNSWDAEIDSFTMNNDAEIGKFNAIAKNTTTGKLYDSLSAALSEAASFDFVILLADIENSTDNITVPEGAFLDLNNHVVKTTGTVTNGGVIILYQKNADIVNYLLYNVPGAYSAAEELKLPSAEASVYTVPKGAFVIAKVSKEAPAYQSLQFAIGDDPLVWNTDVPAGMQLGVTYVLTLGGDILGAKTEGIKAAKVEATYVELSKNIAIGSNTDGDGEAILFVKSYENETGSLKANGHKITLNKTGKLVVSSDVALDTSVLVCGAENTVICSQVDEDAGTVTYFLADAQARIGSVNYLTLEAAIAAANTGETVTLLNNISLSKQIVVDKEVVLDLNGKTIAAAADFNFPARGIIGVNHGGDLTVMDSSAAQTGAIDANGKVYAAIAMVAPGDTDETNPAKLTVNSGTLKGMYYGIAGNGSEGRGNTAIVVNGGTITSTEGLGIFHPQIGTVEVNGGEIIGVESGIEMRSGELTVTDGKITATAESFSEKANGSGSTVIGAAVALSQHSTNNPLSATIMGGTLTGVKAFYEVDLQDEDVSEISATISGGTFDGKVESENVKSFITGGSFSAEPEGVTCPDDMCYALNEDGKTYSPKAHDFTKEVKDDDHRVSEATCVDDAVYYYECSRCGVKSSKDTFADEGSKLGHDFTEKIKDETHLKSAATCENNAVYYYDCSRCDKISSTDTWSIDNTATGHTYEVTGYEWNAAGTECTATKTCSQCAAEELNHVVKETAKGSYVTDTDATCEADETGHYVATFEDTDFTEQSTEKDSFTQTGTKLGHSWSGWQQETGNAASHVKICSNDPAHKDYQAHTWNKVLSEDMNTMTCTCTVCGYVKYEDVADICVAVDEISELAAGTFNICFGSKEAGKITLEKANGGWYLIANGKYIGRNGTYIVNEKQIWHYSYGKFYQNVTTSQSRSFFLWNILFGRKTISTDYYLTYDNAYGVNTDAANATVVLSKSTAAISHAGGHFRSVGNNQHEEYCANCGKSLGNVSRCQYVDGVCKFCGASDPTATGMGMFDITVDIDTHNFLFFKLYTAHVYASSRITGIKSVEFAEVHNLVYTSRSLMSTKGFDDLIIMITTTNGAVYAFRYDTHTGIFTPDDLI